MSPESNERLASLETKVQLGHERVMEGINDLKEMMHRMDSEMRAKHADHYIKAELQSNKITAIETDFKNVSGAVDHHIKNHWSWLGIVTGAVGFIMAVAKFIGAKIGGTQ